MQVMEEGERLSKKQSSMEGTIKKLRQQIRDLEATQGQAASKLAGEESKLEAAVKARQQAEASLAASLQQHKAEADQQKQQYEALLARARSSQVCRAPSHHATGPLISSSLPPPPSHRAMPPLIMPWPPSSVQVCSQALAGRVDASLICVIGCAVLLAAVLAGFMYTRYQHAVPLLLLDRAAIIMLCTCTLVMLQIRHWQPVISSTAQGTFRA